MPEIRIDETRCDQCGLCLLSCPKQVFSEAGQATGAENCTDCGTCRMLCPRQAIAIGQAQKSGGQRTMCESISRGGWSRIKSLCEHRCYNVIGNEAVVMGAFDAGCRYYAGYPITPASEIITGIMNKMETLTALRDQCCFRQMEDEIASIGAVIGASIAGTKAMTATSGPGLSLMQEQIGYAVMNEIPCVIVDVMRVGPSTGMATCPAQGDLLAAVSGTHGDAPRIVLAPGSAQECYDLTIKAFNLAEEYRTPVIILIDELVSRTWDVIKTVGHLDVFNRIYVSGRPHFGPTPDGRAPSMPGLDDGENISFTGSTHTEYGSRTIDPEVGQGLSDYLRHKIGQVKTEPPESYYLSSENDLVIITWGAPRRSARAAIENIRAKRQGSERTGLITLKTIYPFPHDYLKTIRSWLPLRTRIAVPEMNQGQLVQYVRRVFPEATALGQTDGLPIASERIIRYIEKGEWSDEYHHQR